VGPAEGVPGGHNSERPRQVGCKGHNMGDKNSEKNVGGLRGHGGEARSKAYGKQGPLPYLRTTTAWEPRKNMNGSKPGKGEIFQ